jgi:hypothetical protein
MIGLFSSLFYSQQQIHAQQSQQTSDIVFETTNASAQPFDDHNIMININNFKK